MSKALILADDQKAALLSYLKERFVFDRYGNMIRKDAPPRGVWRVGTIDVSTGYVRIRAAGRLYYLHRLVWLLKTGDYPSCDIDHVDLNKANNNFSNLRLATRSENRRNGTATVQSKTGIRGVYKYHNGKFVARLTDRTGKIRHIGYFFTLEEAAQAVDAFAKREHGEFYHPISVKSDADAFW